MGGWGGWHTVGCLRNQTPRAGAGGRSVRIEAPAPALVPFEGAWSGDWVVLVGGLDTRCHGVKA